METSYRHLKLSIVIFGDLRKKNKRHERHLEGFSDSHVGFTYTHKY